MLSELLKKLLASTYAYSLKAKYFHWNVESSDFYQLHKFFDKIHDDAYSAVDAFAEYIRSIDEYAPGSFQRYQELTVIPDQVKVPRAQLMIQELLADTDNMIQLLNEAFAAAEGENKQAIANFIAERLSSHEKYRWQLRSTLKNERA